MAFTILTKKAFLFINHAERKKSQDEASAKNFVRVMPGDPAEVPDWVREDRIYKLGSSDGDIMEVVTAASVSVPKEMVTDEAAEVGIQVPRHSRKRSD